MTFLESGARALAEFQTQPYDVIVSDICMPAMHETRLLRTVSDRAPEAARIALSGAGNSISAAFPGVSPAQDGSEALARILDGSFQMLITDWVMPGIDGGYAVPAYPGRAASDGELRRRGYGAPKGDATTATAAALLGRADSALYRSKNAGRNCVTSAAHVGQWSSEWTIQPTRL